MCGAVCVKLAIQVYVIERIFFIIHLIIITKSEVSTFPIVVIFFHGRVPEVVASLYAVGFIYVPKKLVLFLIIVQSYDLCK